MILALALKNPQVLAEAADRYNKPGQVDAAQLRSSVSDFAMETLTCYHKTARFRGVEVLGAPWPDQVKYGAENSAVLRINFQGISGLQYQMIVAAMAKENSYRTFVMQDSATIPYNINCKLERWTTTSQG